MSNPITKLGVRTIRANGSRAIADTDLAALFGISLPQMYKQIGNKLFRFTPAMCCKLSTGRERGRTSEHPRLAFSCSGAIVLAGIIEGGAKFHIGTRVAHALRNRRRASTLQKRRNKRDYDFGLWKQYHEARMQLYAGPFGHLLPR